MTAFVLFGSRNDPHIDRIGRALDDRGEAVFLVNPLSEHAKALEPLHWEPTSPRPALRLPRLGGGSDDVDLADSVWLFRNKVRVARILSPADQNRFFEIDARTAFLRGVANARGARIVNNTDGAHSRYWKITQLEIAARCGLRTPATAATSDRHAAIAFVRATGDCIIKPLSEAHVPTIEGEDHASAITLMTNPITVDELEAATDAEFAAGPVLIQERLDKSHELRIVAFGDDLLSYRVMSQSQAHTSLDWRRGERDGIVETEPSALDPAIRAALRRFMAESGLDTGVFDFVVKPDGTTVFLECNPSGQWAALEPGPTFPVAGLFAQGLVTLSAGRPASAPPG